MAGTDLNLDYQHGVRQERIRHVLARKSTDINVSMTVQR